MSARVRDHSVLRALLRVAITSTLYLAAVVGIVFTPPWAWLVLAPLAGLILSILFVLGHDAAHGSLTPHAWLNNLLGRLIFIPSLHNYTGWCHAHNNVHHGWTNFQPRDYVWAPLSRDEYEKRSAFGRWWYRFGRWWPAFGFYYSIDILFRKITFVQSDAKQPQVRRRWRFDTLVLLVGVAAMGAAIVYGAKRAGIATHPALLIVGAILVPAFVCHWLLGFLTYLHHTHPAIPWFADRSQWSFYQGQVRGTTHVQFPAGINGMIHNIMEHTAHHVDQSIPHYHLPEAQRQIERAHAPVIARFTPRSFMYIQRVCQLYDFENHRWLSYAGEAMSSRTVSEEMIRPASKPEPAAAAVPSPLMPAGQVAGAA